MEGGGKGSRKNMHGVGRIIKNKQATDGKWSVFTMDMRLLAFLNFRRQFVRIVVNRCSSSSIWVY